MSDGGGADSRRENQQDGEVSKRSVPDEFGRAVSKIAVAQICESVGFQSFEGSALEALSDVAVRYLRDLGKTSGFYANLAGRTECNVFDVIRGLEDLGSWQGFSGASEVGHCLSSSGAVKELVEFVVSTEEVPFAQPVPMFPVIRERRLVPSFMQMGETPAGKHIPDWLPAFPDPHTYIHTPVWNERETDPRADKIEQARQRRKAERSLLNLQKRLICIASDAPSGSVVHLENDAKEIRMNGSNPFLDSPLQPGEKDVSSVVLPAKLLSEAVLENHVPVLEAFSPAIEAVKGGFCDLGDNERNVLSEKRPAVHFKLGTAKKLLCEPLGLSLRNRGVRNWQEIVGLGQDEERDDRKRKAELILRQSIENPQELTQL